MATPENTFIQGVHRHLPTDLYRMKNHNQYNGGIPDVWYSGPAGDLWIEYKFNALPKRRDTLVAINLSELQKDWLRCRHAEGRSVGVVVGCKEGGVWFPGLSWEPEITAEEFRERISDRKALAAIIVAAIT